MRVHQHRGILCLSLLMVVMAPSAARAEQASEQKAFFRSGQTFITWAECGAAKYRLYRAAGKITDLKAVKLIATVPKGSSSYKLEQTRKVLAKIAGKGGYGRRYIIQDNPGADPAKMLAADTGLFVYTPHEAGTFYYAVTAVNAGKENTALTDANRLAKGVAEKAQPIGAVLVFKAPAKDGKGKVVGEKRVYCHWMDAAKWNPVPDGGYAYNFGVGIPAGKKARGMIVWMHGYSGYYGLRGPVYNMVSITPGDPYQTWFYGHRDATGKTVVNYTERRMLLTIDFVARQLTSEGVDPNPNKIYAFGASMGGTGGNFLGARYGNVFTAAIASLGAVDHNRNGKWTRVAEQRLWGKRSEKLPTSGGGSVWDHQNLIKWHLANVGRETAFMLDGHASNDGSIPFDAVPDYYEALQKAKRPFMAIWGPWGHSGIHEPKSPNHRWWGTLQFNKDESLPAVAFATSSDDPRKKRRAGQINCKLEWSARENDFDKRSTADDVVDEPGRWGCCLRSLAGKQTASITPRRCRKFKPRPGAKCRWENHSYADPAKPAKITGGTVTADKHGLVTVEKFEFGKAGWGNRLIIHAEK